MTITVFESPVYGILESDAVNSGTSVSIFRRSPLSRISRLTFKFQTSVSSEAIVPIFDTPRLTSGRQVLMGLLTPPWDTQTFHMATFCISLRDSVGGI
jgi:hypothetical protein